MPDARIPEVDRGKPVTLVFDGRELPAYEGETIGMALWANGIRAVRSSSRDAQPRGMFCAMGICYDCLVDLDGRPVRACVEPVVGPRMVVGKRGPQS